MQTVWLRERVRQVLAVFLCVGVLSPVAAGTITWSKTAEGTYDFTNTVNWTGGVVPGTADTAQFNAPNADQTIVGGDSQETAGHSEHGPDKWSSVRPEDRGGRPRHAGFPDVHGWPEWMDLQRSRGAGGHESRRRGNP